MKREMTEEVKRLMAGLLPCGNDWTIDYTPEAYKDMPDEFKPVFTLKPYSSKELKDVIAKTQTLKGDALDKYAHNVVKEHIKSWSNFIDISTQEDIEFDVDDKGILKQELYEVIPVIIQTQLMSRLTEISSGIKV